MPVVAFLSGNDGLSSSSNSLTVTIPALGDNGVTPVTAGMVAVVVTQANNAGAQHAPTGWNLKSGPDNSSNALVTYVWTRTLTSGDVGATRTFTAGTSGRFTAAGDVLSGVTESGLLIPAPQQDTTADSALVPPTLTTGATPPAWEIVELWCLRVAATSAALVTPPSTHTLDGQVRTSFGTSPNFTIAVSHRTGGGVASTQYGTTAGNASASVTDNLYTLAFPATAVNATPPAATATVRVVGQAGKPPSIDANPPAATARVTVAGQAPVARYQIAALFTAIGGKYVRPSPTSLPPAGTPTAPTAVRASLSGTLLTETWAVPVSDGGSAITSYTATNLTTGEVHSGLSPSTFSTTFTVTAGGAYRVSVAAVNSAGTGAAATASVSGKSVARYPGDTRPLLTGQMIWGIDERDHDPSVLDPQHEGYAPEAHSGGLRCGAMRLYDGTSDGWTMLNTGGAFRSLATAQLNSGRIPWISVTSVNFVADADGRRNAVTDSFIAWAEAQIGPIWFTLDHEVDAKTKIPDRGSWSDFLNLCRWWRSRMDAYAIAQAGSVAAYKWQNLAFGPILTAAGFTNGDIDLFIPNPSADKHTFDFIASDPYVQAPTSPGFTVPFQKAVAWSMKYGWPHMVGEYGIPSNYSDGAQKMLTMFNTITNGSYDVGALCYWNNAQQATDPLPLANLASNGFMGTQYVNIMKDPRVVRFFDLTRPDGTRYTKPPGA